MALNPNYEAIGKAFTTQYYQVLLGFVSLSCPGLGPHPHFLACLM